MTSAQLAARAYSTHGEFTRGAKDQEYDVILDVTRALSAARDRRGYDFPGFVAALNKNERLWVEIGAQVAAPDNQLPQQLRASLFYMSRFVTHHTSEIMQGSGSVQNLIEMNVAILRGLKGGG